MGNSGGSDRDRGMMEKMGRSVGGMAGRAADAAAEIGGSMVRGAADVLGGWWAGSGARDALRTWTDQQDRSSRQHFESSAGASGYDSARPYYQFGHTARQNPDYAARGFDEVEPELRRAVEKREEERDWPDVRGYVQFGYEGAEPDTTGRDEPR